MSSSESTATPSTRTSSTLDTERALSPTPNTNSAKDRISPFSIALLLLLLQWIIVIILCALPPSFLTGTLAIVMALFLYEWSELHLPALTRRRRPFFDELNILETYQPRARTMGHLFVPDPPTPAANDERPQRTKEERDAFTIARDAHYENQAIEAASKKAEIDRFLKASADSELIPTSKRIDTSNMTIGEIIAQRKREKEEAEKRKGQTPSKAKALSPSSPNDNTDTCGVIKRENL